MKSISRCWPLSLVGKGFSPDLYIYVNNSNVFLADERMLNCHSPYLFQQEATEPAEVLTHHRGKSVGRSAGKVTAQWTISAGFSYLASIILPTIVPEQ
jgi:hypothetical protein